MNGPSVPGKPQRELCDEYIMEYTHDSAFFQYEAHASPAKTAHTHTHAQIIVKQWNDRDDITQYNVSRDSDSSGGGGAGKSHRRSR